MIGNNIQSIDFIEGVHYFRISIFRAQEGKICTMKTEANELGISNSTISFIDQSGF